MKKIVLSLLVLCVMLAVIPLCGCKKDTAKSSYQIDVELNGNTLSGKETFTFYNNYDTSFTCLKFNLYANAFRKGAVHSPVADEYYKSSYYKGISYGSMEIQSVKSQGNDLQFCVCGEDLNILNIDLNSEVFPNESVTVEIEYVIILANVVARTGINDKTVNLANFYPVLCAYDDGGFYECVYYSVGDPFYSECADYNVNITCDQNYVIASSGNLFDSSVKEGVKTCKYKLDNARSFTLVLSKDFKVLTKEVLGINVNYYYYDDDAPETSVEFIEKSLRLYSDKFGKYVYDHYSVVQTRFCQGGMEYPALVMVSDSLTGLEYGEVIAHETAHEWWQVAVGCNEVEYGFLDEGLAEYSVILFYENYPEYGLKREELIENTKRTYKTFCSVYDSLYKDVNTCMLRSLDEYKSEYEYVNIAYLKGCLLYENLRNGIGDEKFFDGLKEYYAEFTGKNATPYDVAGIYDKICKDSGGLFDSFYSGKVIL